MGTGTRNVDLNDHAVQVKALLAVSSTQPPPAAAAAGGGAAGAAGDAEGTNGTDTSDGE